MIYAFDTETHLIEPGRLAPRLVCLSWSDGKRGGLLPAADGVQWFCERLAEGATLIAHNAAFDLAVIMHHDPHTVPIIFEALEQDRIRCTMIREQLIAIALSCLEKWKTSLDACVGRRFEVSLTGKKGPDVWRLRYHELEDLPIEMWPSAARTYAIEDAEWCYRVYEHQNHTTAITDAGRPVVQNNTIPDEGAQLRAAFALHLASCWGLRTDPAKVAPWLAAIQTEVDKGQDAARRAGFLRPNGSRDMAKLRALVLEELGNPPRTPKGQIKTDRDTLSLCQNPLIQEYAKSTFAAKLLTTYAPILESGTKYPIQPRYRVLVRSGRTACAKPNLQNPPRAGGFRECFRPRPGWVYVLCDYDQIELCALAQLHRSWFGSSAMADAIHKGRDLHIHLAAQLSGTDYETLKEKIESGDKRARALRQHAKIANYGFPGGLSADTFREYAKGFGVDFTTEDAREIRSAWLKAWPEQVQYFERISNAAFAGEFTAIQEGSERQRGGCKYTSGSNTYFQGLCADGAKAALFEVSKRCYTEPKSALYSARVVIFLHDEIILEAPEGRARAAGLELAEVMIEQMQTKIPDVPIRCVPVLSHQWSKDAEAVTNAAGELIPWGSP